MPSVTNPKLYKWTPGREGSFKNCLTFAWYQYTEGKSELKRIESAHCLNLILLSARQRGLNNRLLSEISIRDIDFISESLKKTFSSDRTQKKTLLFLLKFFHILHNAQLTDINLIDLAFSL